MKKTWKWIVLLLAVCACLFLWRYYETDINFATLLPAEKWEGATVHHYYANVLEQEVPLDDVLNALNELTVDRGPAFHSMPTPFYMIVLEAVDGPGTRIYALPDGRVSMSVDMENYRYFENGEELYAALKAMLASE